MTTAGEPIISRRMPGGKCPFLPYTSCLLGEKGGRGDQPNIKKEEEKKTACNDVRPGEQRENLESGGEGGKRGRLTSEEARGGNYRTRSNSPVQKVKNGTGQRGGGVFERLYLRKTFRIEQRKRSSTKTKSMRNG